MYDQHAFSLRQKNIESDHERLIVRTQGRMKRHGQRFVSRKADFWITGVSFEIGIAFEVLLRGQNFRRVVFHSPDFIVDMGRSQRPVLFVSARHNGQIFVETFFVRGHLSTACKIRSCFRRVYTAWIRGPNVQIGRYSSSAVRIEHAAMHEQLTGVLIAFPFANGSVVAMWRSRLVVGAFSGVTGNQATFGHCEGQIQKKAN